MKEIFRQVKKFLVGDFRILSYGLTFLLFGLILYFNYFFSTPYLIPLKIFGLANPLLAIIFFFFFYLGFYLVIFIFHFISHLEKGERKEFDLNFTSRFFLKITLGLLLFSTLRIYPLEWFKEYVQGKTFSYETIKYMLTVGVFYSVSLASLLGLSFIHLSFDKNQRNFYGIKISNLKNIFKIYLPIFFLIIPLILLANVNQDLRNYYPLYRGIKEPNFILNNWQALTLFEVGYGFFLFNTELFFRGFLVISLAREVGKKAVLPASLTYALVHLGKPLGETLSSFFGGYILGVMALKHQSIFLGIFHFHSCRACLVNGANRLLISELRLWV